MTDTINQVGASAPADRLREALAGLLAIVDDSRGVSGYHLNGAIAEWEKFPEVEAARATLDDLPECGCCGKTGECDADCDARQAAPAAPVADGTTSDKYRAELYDEVWQRARDMGYGNVTDALVELERMKAAAPVAQDTCSTCRGSGKELSVYGPATPCRDCQAAPVVQEEPVAWEVSSYGGRVDCIVVREDVAQDRAELRRINGAADVRVRPLCAAPPAHPDAALVEALEHARQFIRNGIDLGFIRMPDGDTPDPAHETLPKIEAALSTCRAALAGKGGE